MTPVRVSVGCCLGLLIASCQPSATPAGDGPLIASVGTRELYLGDVAGVVPPGASARDSVAVLREYAERWVRDAAVTEAALQDVTGAGPAIERLVDDYRDRLLRLRFERRRAESGIDTAVSADELRRLHDSEKLTVDAPNGIARVILLRYAGELPDEASFDEDWSMLRRDTAARARVLAHGDAYAELALTDDTVWRDVGAVAALASGLDPGRIRGGANVMRKGSYLRVFDYVAPGELAPLAYVRDRLRQTSLTRRRADYLAAERTRLYQAARQRDDVKIYLSDE